MDLVFRTRNAADGSQVGSADEKMRIDSSGNVGIGTTSPDVKLHVYNGDSGATTVGGASDELILENDTDCGLTIRSGKSSDGVISFADSDDHNVGQVYYSHGSNSMTFRTNDNTAVTIDSSQRVGIGLTNPDAKLEVTGSGSAYTFRGVYSGTNGSSAAGAFQLTGGSTGPSLIDFIYSTTFVGQIVTTGTAVLYQSNSDYRLNENIVEMTGALDRVSQLKPSRFNFIADANTTVDGFLAHELQEIVPQAVSGEKDAIRKDGTPKYQGVDHSQIVPLLVGAIKELKAEIELLKNK